MTMNKQCLKNGLGWGSLLWLVGYVLGLALFGLVPPAALGWVIAPIGLALTWWVLAKKIRPSQPTYWRLSIVWTLLAVALDYIFIVKLLRPADGYYKVDVYFYYAATFVLPLIAGWRFRHSVKH